MKENIGFIETITCCSQIYKDWKLNEKRIENKFKYTEDEDKFVDFYIRNKEGKLELQKKDK